MPPRNFVSASAGLGALGWYLPEAPSTSKPPAEQVEVVVVDEVAEALLEQLEVQAPGVLHRPVSRA